MHVIVPTSDFIRLMSRLKPMKSLVTTGFTFTIYTIEAKDNKLRLIVSDNASITASSEIFATIKQPGTISVNGTDFFQLVSKLPHTNNPNLQSKDLELKADRGTLSVSTASDYTNLGASVSQSRSFTLVNAVLSARDEFVPQGVNAVKVTLPALYLADVFRALGKIIANYTSSIAGLAGVLVRCKNKKLIFAVSDGFRIIEISYPGDVVSTDFDLILPKVTCMVMQALLSDGDNLEMWSDGHQVKFVIDNSGLRTSILSSIIMAYFPPYSSVFDITGTVVKLNTKLLVDNVSNVRKAIDEDPYRIKINFTQKVFNIYNHGQGTHISFKNEGIPLLQGPPQPQDLVINAVLLDSSLSILGSDVIQITIPSDKKPIIVDNLDDNLRIKIAIALVDED
jgi:DNA polymerase III sliding clamp (beta) subunit (PCNA family)